MLQILTMPSVANKNFPYHVRTTQIGVMELTGASGGNTIEQFGHHAYEPSGAIREQTVIVPLTRRTEEIFEGMYNQPVVNIRQESLNEEISNRRNIMMENVMSWSLARNVEALEAKNVELARRASFGNSWSEVLYGFNGQFLASSHSGNDSGLTSRRSSTHQVNGHFDDYVREVPIQLFTVSRMVAGTTENTSDTPNGKAV